MRYAFVAGLIAATQAVKQNIEQYDSMYNREVLQGYMSDWYATVAKPFLDEHRDAVEAQAKENVIANNENWWSLTCDLGETCREESKAEITKQIKEGWMTLFAGWRHEVDAQILRTRTLIQTAYDNAITCAEDNQCCSVEQTIYENYLLQIDITEKTIQEKQWEWDQLEIKRLEIEAECPDQDYESVLIEYGRL